MLALSHLSTATAARDTNISATKKGWRQFFANLMTAFSACAW
jgi:hypothetical protein